jgi:hypothetical protein
MWFFPDVSQFAIILDAVFLEQARRSFLSKKGFKHQLKFSKVIRTFVNFEESNALE